MELGVVLRTMGRHGPHGHRAFSELVFGQDFVGVEAINEAHDGGEDVGYEEDESSQLHESREPASSCGYLEDDDIEDW
jgi:hypothetical protein